MHPKSLGPSLPSDANGVSRGPPTGMWCHHGFFTWRHQWRHPWTLHPLIFPADTNPTQQGLDPEQVQQELAQVAVHLQEPVVLPLGTVHLSWTVSAEPRYWYRPPSAEHPPMPPFPRVLRWSAKHPSFRATGCCTGGAAGAGRRRGRCGRQGSGEPCSPSCAGARTTRSRSDPIFITSMVPTALCVLCAPLKRVSVGMEGIVWVPRDNLEVIPHVSSTGSPQRPAASCQRGWEWYQCPHLMAATTAGRAEWCHP